MPGRSAGATRRSSLYLLACLAVVAGRGRLSTADSRGTQTGASRRTRRQAGTAVAHRLLVLQHLAPALLLRDPAHLRKVKRS